MKSNRKPLLAFASLIAVAGTLAFAQSKHETKDAPQMQPPPGWTEADMQACMEAGMPGEQHAHLAKAVGTWQGKTTMWFTPDSEPMASECTMNITSIMDGRFTKAEMSGEVPGMGMMSGVGHYGYDNVAKQYQAHWITNCGTAMMNGTGELSSDGKTMTWTYAMHCPIRKALTTMRDVERRTGESTMTLESYSTDPKTGKEFKMMEAKFTRKPSNTATAVAPTSGH